MIFHLRLGQRGLFDSRPHHRLGAAIELAGAGEFHDLAGDLRFRVVAHGEIRVVPVAGHAEPLEFLALHVDPFIGEDAAFLAEFHLVDSVLVEPLGAILLLDLPFDRKAMAIPAGDVVRILAQHLLRAHDQILQDLVERMPDMDVAIGIGRAIMQHEAVALLARPLLAQLAIEVDLVPAGEEFRLTPGQAGAHREIRLRQVEGGSVIGARR